MNKRRASILTSTIAFFSVFFIFCAFAIDFSMVVASRYALQNAVETTVLGSVEKISSNNAEETANKIFNYIKADKNKYAQITNIKIKKPNNAILVEASTPAPTFFLSALGINSVVITARSAAAIKPTKLALDNTISIDNHLQYIAPNIFFDKGGGEIKVTSTNSSDQYRVFIGLNDNYNETKWVEISCSSNDIEAKEQYFSINAQCVKEQYNGGITAAKTIRIINNSPLTPFEIQEIELVKTSRLIPFSEFINL